MAIALVAVVMLFVSSTMVFLLRARVGTWNPSIGRYVQDWRPAPLPFRLLLVNTLLLAASSISLEAARREAAERTLLGPLSSIPGVAVRSGQSIPWLAISTLLGMAFLAGQLLAWHIVSLRELAVSGDAGDAGASFFYFLSGIHGIHLLGGLLALLYAGATTSLLAKPLEVRRIVVDVTAWYWHVMTVLWLYVLVSLALT
jgi:cytochrome c oxidase subunit 3